MAIIPQISPISLSPLPKQQCPLLYFPQKSPFFYKNTNFSTNKPKLSLSLSSNKSISQISTSPVSTSNLSRLKTVSSNLSKSKTLIDKIRVIERDVKVKKFEKSRGFRVLERLKLSDYEVYLLKCVICAGQEHVITSRVFEERDEIKERYLKKALFNLVEIIENLDVNDNSSSENVKGGFGEELSENEVKDLRVLIKVLKEIEEFYNCIGGIVGYQTMALELLEKSTAYGGQISNFPHHNNGRLTESQFLGIHPPKVLDLSKDAEYASQAALWGLEGLPDLGEIYPLGGSADRLGLVDSETGECLPAAMLPFCGRTLLEGLIRDLQAREFLYYKLHGTQCITPVAIMTSSAKNNHKRITSLCEKLGWFGRGQSRFQLFEQGLKK